MKFFSPLATLAMLTAAGMAQAQVAGPDLTITQTTPAQPSQGVGTSVRITVTNVGDAPATSFLVTGGVGSASLNTIGGGGASCAKGRNSVYTCALPGLAVGASTDLFESATVDRNAVTFTSNANVSGGNDANFNNNRSSVSAAVLGTPPDLQMSGSLSDKSPSAAQQVDFRYQLKATGSSTAAGVVFTDVVPAELTLIGVGNSLGAPCDVAGNVITCQLGDIAGGGQAIVTVTALAPAGTGVTVSNTGTALAADGRDAQLSNNSLTLSLTTR